VVAVLLAGVAVGAVLAVVALKAAPLLASKQPSGVRTPRIIRISRLGHSICLGCIFVSRFLRMFCAGQGGGGDSMYEMKGGNSG